MRRCPSSVAGVLATPTSRWGLVAREPWAIAETWRRFAPMVLLTAERSLGSRIEAEDIVQEVFWRVFRKAQTLRDPERLRSFIYSFAVRVLKAELRRRRVRGWLPFLKAEEPPDVRLPSVGFRVARSAGEAVRACSIVSPPAIAWCSSSAAWSR